MNLYRERLMDHYRNPRNTKQLKGADFTSGQFNPSCGDVVTFEGCVEDHVLTQVSFAGKGCVISQAAASLLSEHCLNKFLDYILALTKDDMRQLIGMDLGPVRLKCALLPLQALQEGVLSYTNKHVVNEN
jgi:nitrogen fixation protein NifU and related proteins